MPNKDEPNRLLSKVAKFVRNPLKDWSELDSDDSSTGEAGYSREMLKDMIERRQRNDFVRRREFDMLRKLRQREASGGNDPAATPSSFNVSSTSGKTEGRALTLKKIDEIEEQMSQQWWKNRGPNGAAPGSDAATPADAAAALRTTSMAAQHARAYADTLPGVAPPAGLDADAPSKLPADGSAEEAAVRFAHHDDAGTEAILLQALGVENPDSDHEEVWHCLFDLYRATDEDEKFSAAGIRYAQRTHRVAPPWVSLRGVAREVEARMASGGRPLAPLGSADWFAPGNLNRESLLELTRALSAAGPIWKLDWSALQSIEPDAAGPLRALFAHWADSAVQIRFSGSDRLIVVLSEATPVNDRQVDAVWWQLHMAAMRLMGRDDEFELLALNYCITYEVSPPPWEDPKGAYSELETLPVGSGPAAPDYSLAAVNPAEAPAVSPVNLAGELEGESLSTWQRLDADLGKHPMAPISCAGLVRLDFAAAGTLLNWVMARDARGQRVRFVDAHRLVGIFFGVIGITHHADVVHRSN
ncbi:conserved hypothetical protein [Burkholderiales bacterium 8X]|nr:conserved hypothetical protein [Burkholderiales bacterium 8X]